MNYLMFLPIMIHGHSWQPDTGNAFFFVQLCELPVIFVDINVFQYFILMLILCPLVGHLPNYGGYKYLNASVLVFYSLFCLVGVFKKQ